MTSKRTGNGKSLLVGFEWAWAIWYYASRVRSRGWLYHAEEKKQPQIPPLRVGMTIKRTGNRKAEAVWLLVGFEFDFEDGVEVGEALHLALVFVNVLDGDDAAGDLAVRIENGSAGEADPGA
jgi:hypothetical protein